MSSLFWFPQAECRISKHTHFWYTCLQMQCLHAELRVSHYYLNVSNLAFRLGQCFVLCFLFFCSLLSLLSLLSPLSSLSSLSSLFFSLLSSGAHEWAMSGLWAFLISSGSRPDLVQMSSKTSTHTFETCSFPFISFSFPNFCRFQWGRPLPTLNCGRFITKAFCCVSNGEDTFHVRIAKQFRTNQIQRNTNDINFEILTFHNQRTFVAFTLGKAPSISWPTNILNQWNAI